MASGAGKKSARASRDRARLYQARREFHQGLEQRRRRDNIVAGVAGGALILAVIAGQVAYFTVGPGQPAPAPSPTPTSSPSPTAGDQTPAPQESPSPLSPVSPSPTPTP